MVVNIPGVIGIVVFYIIIVVIGIWAGRKNKKGDTNDLLVAGRSLGMFVATLTTAGDLFWEAAIFNALGATVSIILGIEMSIAIIVSAVIVIVYTFFGGLYSVAYTDVIQMFFIIIGLVIALPFAWTNPAVDFSKISNTWQGEMDSNQIGIYIDTYLLTLGGCLTWQAFYQRILACKSVTVARNSALLGAGISWLMAIPPAAIGVIGAATDWNMTSYPQNSTLSYEDWAFILPMVMEYLCPLTVSIIGFGAISAAVMSSADSIVLATGSVFSRNIYQNCFRPQASDRELTWVLRFSIVVVGTLGAVIAISANSIYGLYILCADAMYVVQFPVLTCALWVPFANTYGAISGFVVGTTLRVLGGEPVLSFPAIIKYPGTWIRLNEYDDVKNVIKRKIKERGGLKWYLSMKVKMSRRKEDAIETAEPHFRGKCQTSLKLEDIDAGLKESIKKMYTSFIEYQRQGSNWTVDKVVDLTIHMARYRPLKAQVIFHFQSNLDLNMQ
ncbi:CHT1 [Mytilus edulis]|uniref:SLC5A7 n=1 Tax=Mytilus edulis TaxID=6550 RepID=A0A8S3TDE2_MYTED|nr:CHT1 [Mytilus edulis]